VADDVVGYAPGTRRVPDPEKLRTANLEIDPGGLYDALWRLCVKFSSVLAYPG
jgi:hypothetical protein